MKEGLASTQAGNKTKQTAPKMKQETPSTESLTTPYDCCPIKHPNRVINPGGSSKPLHIPPKGIWYDVKIIRSLIMDVCHANGELISSVIEEVYSICSVFNALFPSIIMTIYPFLSTNSGIVFISHLGVTLESSLTASQSLTHFLRRQRA